MDVIRTSTLELSLAFAMAMLATATLTMFLGQGPVPFSYGLDQSIPCPRGSNQDSVMTPMLPAHPPFSCSYYWCYN